MKKLLHYAKKEIVLSVSFVLAIISCFFVRPDATYISYIDFRTLAILFSLMVIMAGLQKLLVFRQLGELLVEKVHTMTGITLIFVMLCFFLSMFITNDVALITFVPFTVVVLNMAGHTEKMIEIIVLETVAANLGSMLLPMGNPQNLYLYSLTDLSLGSFFLLMLPYGAISLVLILILCVVMTRGTEVHPDVYGYYKRTQREKIRFAAYLILFVLSLLVVMRVVNYWIGLVIVIVVVVALDRKIFPSVDATLLFTFLFLFIFIGNLKRIPAVSDLLSMVVGGHEILTGVLVSQVTSNVPAAILLSGFTNNIEGLLIGTNLGGLGTLIASMASLISFKQYGNVEGAKKGRYMAVFTVVNVGLLVILSCAAWGLRL